MVALHNERLARLYPPEPAKYRLGNRSSHSPLEAQFSSSFSVVYDGCDTRNLEL